MVKTEKLLPIEKIEGTSSDYIIEPDYKTVLTDSLEVYLKGKLRRIMLSAKCSEQSSRMNAMDGATSNANDILNDLNIKFKANTNAMAYKAYHEYIKNFHGEQ